MKRMFIAAMAIAALVSCSKDEETIVPSVDSLNKSVQIKIENVTPAGRAANVDGISAGNTTATAGTTISSVVDASELKILFANASGVILKEMPLVGTANNHGGEDGTTDLPEYSYGSQPAATEAGASDGLYVFHNVPAAVTQIAVVRYEAGDIKDADGKGGNVVAGTTNISAVKTAAESEELNLQRELEDIVLYDDDPLVSTTGECVTIGGIKYYIYTASVTVSPIFSRLEIDYIKCIDLGEANDDADPATVDFDKLVLNTFTWSKYQILPSELGELNGQYGATADATATEADEAARTCKPTEGVWSWNIKPQAFSKMTLNMTASAKDYKVAGFNEEKQGADVNLYITSLTATQGAWNGSYERNNIYKLSIPFPQSALADQQGICANVTVTIIPWTVNTVTPNFGTN